jgi:ribose 1,5-bisphosphokinase PhnN
VIAEAVSRYPNSCVIIVTAPMEMLAARLAARGREPPAEHRGRLARPDFTDDAGIRPHYVSNDRTPEDGVAALLAILRDLPQISSPLPAASGRAGAALPKAPA